MPSRDELMDELQQTAADLPPDLLDRLLAEAKQLLAEQPSP